MKRNKTFGLVIEFADEVNYFLKIFQGRGRLRLRLQDLG
jgi:hypothetical protein